MSIFTQPVVCIKMSNTVMPPPNLMNETHPKQNPTNLGSGMIARITPSSLMGRQVTPWVSVRLSNQATDHSCCWHCAGVKDPYMRVYEDCSQPGKPVLQGFI